MPDRLLDADRVRNDPRKLRDVAKRLSIDTRKLTEYALDPDHPRGRHKARRFREILGFTPDTAGQLVAQIEAAALDGDVTGGVNDEHGRRFTIDLVITGVSRQQATVRTGWLVPSDSDEARLITIYVRRSR